MEFSDSSISCGANTGFTWNMDIKQIRRSNMLALIGGEKTKAAFARKVGTEPAYISQILSTKTKADIGDVVARAIEKAYGLDYGWMDHEHHTAAEKADQSIFADFEWTYQTASPAGKKFLLGAIEAAKLAFIEDQKDGRKKA